MLAWIFRRCDNDARARATPIGLIPAPADLSLSGLGLTPSALDELLEVDECAARAELKQIKVYLSQFGERLPAQLRDQLARCTYELTRTGPRDRYVTNHRVAASSAATTTD